MVTPNGETELKIETKRQGILRVSEQLILEWLKFEGGYIRGVRQDIEFGIVELLIEHPDMPDVKTSERTPVIDALYEIDYPDKTITRTAPKRTD